MRCPHANHVLQKCITLLQPDDVQFIVDELLGRDGLMVQATKHRYGCRIVQQLLKRCPSEQVERIVEVLLSDALALSCHPFGNFVMQCLLEHGTEDQRYRMICTLERTASSVCGCA